MSTELCYICGKPLNKSHDVFLQDDNHAIVCVGPNCYERVVKSGYDGVRSGKGRGPLVFVTRRMAEAYAIRARGEESEMERMGRMMREQDDETRAEIKQLRKEIAERQKRLKYLEEKPCADN